jgi:type II secretory pathway component GspD/PulD (secretin)
VLATEFLNYLAARGHAEVITDTRLTLVNHEPAVIESVTDIPYILGGYLGGELVEAPLRDSPPATDADNIIKEFVEGVTISITPMIAGESIELRVIAAVASHVGYTPNQHVPIIASSTVESVLVTQSGAPAVLGGLDRTVTVRQRSGIPLLKEIAGIRNFFSREVERRRRSHIIITLVPNRLEWGEANPAESESVSQALTELNSTSHP